MLLEQLTRSKVAIWGFGVEGKATVDYLLLRCPEFAFTVLCAADEVTEVDSPQVEFLTDEVNTAILSQFDVVIKSPGISPHQDTVIRSTCQIISSSALWFSNEKNGQVIAVTGTKGKSTVCAMLTAVLEALGHRVVLAGNFGLPLIQCLEQCDYVVLETSSYQAQDGAIQSEVALLLNLYSEHLNWHLTEAQYHTDKWQLLRNAKHVVLNAKDANTAEMLKQQPLDSDVHYFEDQQGFYELNEVLMYQDKALISKYGWQLKGRHNLSNAAAVCTIIGLLQADIKVTINALKKFKALPHRLETVAEIGGVTFINDSIASTPHATWAAMSTVALEHTILLVGGFDRGVDWQWWVNKLHVATPKMIICSGQNGEKIQQLILNQAIKTQCIYLTDLKQAVGHAKQVAVSGDSVLFSPGAPSFDAFDDYQHRGQKFLQWIK